jgi:hypothetical protein
MIGQAPDTPAFGRLFDWPDAVVPLPYDSPDIAAVLDTLDADPDRVERAQRANVVNTLRRHDHVYRWAEILSHVGLDPTPAMNDRIQTLGRLAGDIEANAPGDRRADATGAFRSGAGAARP